MRKNKDANNKNDMKGKILDVACKLIVQKGIRETSLKDIAEAVGISKGTLYYYYSVKADIIMDIADSHMNVITTEIDGWFDEITDKLPQEKILKCVFDKILAAETRGKLNLYLVGSAITSNEVLKGHFQNKYREWQISIKNGLDKIYSENQENHEEMSYLILAALDGLIMQRLIGLTNIPVDKIVGLIEKIKTKEE